MDDLCDDHNVKQKGGAIGVLTQGAVLREEAFAQAILYATSIFLPKVREKFHQSQK